MGDSVEAGRDVEAGGDVDSGEAERVEGVTERGSSGETSENRKDKETDGEGETVEAGEE